MTLRCSRESNDLMKLLLLQHKDSKDMVLRALHSRTAVAVYTEVDKNILGLEHPLYKIDKDTATVAMYTTVIWNSIFSAPSTDILQHTVGIVWVPVA